MQCRRCGSRTGLPHVAWRWWSLVEAAVTAGGSRVAPLVRAQRLVLCPALVGVQGLPCNCRPRVCSGGRPMHLVCRGAAPAGQEMHETRRKWASRCPPAHRHATSTFELRCPMFVASRPLQTAAMRLQQQEPMFGRFPNVHFRAPTMEELRQQPTFEALPPAAAVALAGTASARCARRRSLPSQRAPAAACRPSLSDQRLLILPTAVMCGRTTLCGGSCTPAC